MEFNPCEAFLLLFATIGPLKVTIVCASLTAEAPPEFLNRVALRAVMIASIVCVVFAVFGEVILHLFKISVPAFQIGGAIIVLLFSLDMVMGNEKAKKHAAGRDEEAEPPSLDIAVYPLAIPLMASVSGLVAIVSLLALGDDLRSVLFLTAVIVAIMAINYVSLRSCRYIVNGLGPGALQVIGKLMGVILTALAVELILMGLVGLRILEKPAAREANAVASGDEKGGLVEDGAAVVAAVQDVVAIAPRRRPGRSGHVRDLLEPEGVSPVIKLLSSRESRRDLGISRMALSY
jgi:multiple antibiotic resistance protein